MYMIHSISISSPHDNLLVSINFTESSDALMQNEVQDTGGNEVQNSGGDEGRTD